MTASCAMVAVVAACTLSTPNASADTGLVLGFDDNALLGDAGSILPAARDLDARAFRVHVNWSPGQTALTAADSASLDAAVRAAPDFRIVLVVVGGAASYAPQDDASRDTFCNYARGVLARYPTINDAVIWNEPNKTAAWKPQFNPDRTSASPAAYEALLARCYDTLHALRPAINVLGPALSPDGNDNPSAISNISHSPGNFIRRLGTAYRASGRQLPLLDAVAHHVYGATSAERPWRQHPGQTRIAEGDWDKLMTNLHTAFDDTAQPVPGECVAYRCVSIWYMEDGFQTAIDAAKSSFYTDTENVSVIPDDAGGEPSSPPPSATSPAPDQATQMIDSVRLAACQSYVGGFFNYLLRDDADLRGWQSGALWADGTPKDSYWAFRQAFGEANAGSVDCNALKGGLPPRPDSTPPAAPTALVASTVVGQARVSLDWEDNTDGDVAGYDILRATASGGPYSPVNQRLVRGSEFVDTTVAKGTTYYYAVVAQDTAALDSPPSAEVSASPRDPILVEYAPAGYSLGAGRLEGGGALSLLTASDNKRLRVESARSRVQLDVSTLVASEHTPVVTLRLDWEGQADSKKRVTLMWSILDTTTGAWVPIGTRSATPSDSSFSWSSAEAAPYISAQREIRVRISATAASSFRLSTDLVRFTIGY